MYIYKYRNFDINHIKALLNNEIWFSRGDFFNDPLDCTIDVPITFIDGLNSHKFAMENTNLKKYIESGLLTKDDYFRIQQNELDSAQCLMENNMYHEHPLGFLVDIVFANLKRSFICCFAGSSTNHLMWSHYANSHYGFCVRFKKDKLIDNVSILSHGSVNYDGIPVSIMSQLVGDNKERNVVNDVLFKKSPEWAYEQEYRLIHKDFASNESDNFRCFKYDDEAVDCIIFGLRTKQSDIDMIKAIFKDRDIIFKKIIRSKNGFELYVNTVNI